MPPLISCGVTWGVAAVSSDLDRDRSGFHCVSRSSKLGALSKEDAKRSEPREVSLSPAELRAGAQKLAQVVAAADEAALERLRKRRLGLEDVSLDDLRELRQLLAELVLLVEGGASEGWSRLGEARRVLGPEPDDEPSGLDPMTEDHVEPRPPSLPRPERLDRPASGPPPPPRPERPSSEHPRPAPRLEPPRRPEPSLDLPADEAVRMARRPRRPTRDETLGDEGTRVGELRIPLDGGLPFVKPQNEGWAPRIKTEPHPADDRPFIQDDVTMAEISLPVGSPLPFSSAPEASPEGTAESSVESEAATRLFGFSSLAHPLALSIVEYAALCAERRTRPHAQRQVEERYGIHDTPTREALDRYFQLVFAADRDAYATWEQRFQELSRALGGG